MHEVSVVSDLVSAILEELRKYNVVRVHNVTLIIGRMTNLGAEQMEFAYEIVTRDTILEGSSLIIEEEEVTIRCDRCGYDGPAKNFSMGTDHSVPILSCPDCGGAVTITAGQSCCVKNMDIEEDS